VPDDWRVAARRWLDALPPDAVLDGGGDDGDSGDGDGTAAGVQ
jgi:hypothetical protein